MLRNPSFLQIPHQQPKASISQKISFLVQEPCLVLEYVSEVFWMHVNSWRTKVYFCSLVYHVLVMVWLLIKNYLSQTLGVSSGLFFWLVVHRAVIVLWVVTRGRFCGRGRRG